MGNLWDFLGFLAFLAFLDVLGFFRFFLPGLFFSQSQPFGSGGGVAETCSLTS